MASRAKILTRACLVGISGLLASAQALAQPARVVVLPTAVTDQLDCDAQSQPAKPLDPALVGLGRRLDGLVTAAVEDAGMAPELRINSSSTAERGGCVDDADLRALAKQSLVIAPRIVARGGQLMVRIVSASPNSTVLRLATQEVAEKDLDFRAVVMVSELLAAETPKDAATKAPPTQPSDASLTQKPHSQGKGVLALTSALFGMGMGYSLQRASGANDARLTYPLMAIGAGIGIGASLIAAEEWDLSVGEAWYLNAGMLWPTTSGLLLAHSYRAPPNNLYVYGLVGATAGMSLASFALNFKEISEGGAVLTHSGGGVGLLLGGLIDMTLSGRTDQVPYRGMGYGAGAGVLIFGAAATQVKISSSRVLFIDLAAGLGALTGAGSSLLIFENDLISVNRQRTWLGLVGGGALLGAGVGWYLTRNWTTHEHEGSGRVRLWPAVAPVANPSDPVSAKATGLTAGVQGAF